MIEEEVQHQKYNKYITKEVEYPLPPEADANAEVSIFRGYQEDFIEDECKVAADIMSLFDAIRKADYQRVYSLIEENHSLIFCRNNFGWTPLHFIACQGTNTVKEHSSIASLLIANDADVNSIDKNGCTPLHYIAINGCNESLDFAKVLLENNANPNIKNKSGSTPMIMWQHGDKIKELLIRYGASRQH